MNTKPPPKPHQDDEEAPLPRSMKIAVGVSLFLHISLVVAGIVGMPFISKPIILPPQPIAVDIVNVADLTTTDKPPARPALKPVPDKPKETKKEEAPVAPPKVEAKEPPKAVPVEKPPEPKKETVKPEPKVPPPSPDKLEKPKPPEKKKPEEDLEEATTQEDQFLSLMKNLQEAQDSADTGQADENNAEDSPDAPIAQFVTQNELNALTNQLIQCWQIPIGAKDVSGMVVKIRIWANADRTVKRVEAEDQMRIAADPAFRALAESAKRAVLDPFCSPLQIPEDKYEVWKDQYIVVPFDPSRVT